MKKLIIAVSLLTTAFASNAQMSLDHSYSLSTLPYFGLTSEVVNLSISGKKIAVVTDGHTLSFYNLDYSLWKTISMPLIAGSYPWSLALGTGARAMYPSEELFNTDALLEVAVFYGAAGATGTIYIINENGIATDSIQNVNATNSFSNIMSVYSTASNTFKALVTTPTGTSIYSLPGTIPCDVCGNGLGLGKASPKSSGISDPVPNPSSEQTKLTFTLPAGTNQGEISIYSTTGQLIKTYKVDNTFGYVLVDNSMLPAGIYYYNLVANGNVSTTKKMLVIR